MTQREKVLDALQAHRGEWISGRFFLRNLFLSQYHARIFELQREGHKIEASEFKDDFGFKSYKLLLEDPSQLSLI